MARCAHCDGTIRMTRKLGLLFALVLVGVPRAARADDYFVIVYGAESDPRRPKFSHSWATFVRVGPNGCEPVTLSWMPAEIEIHPNRFWSEPGVNLDLPTSFQVALEHCENVDAWGPYRIECELFARA